jgi:hypothetical protein
MKYPNSSLFRALLSITYFDDAESEAMPKMFATVTWDEIKTRINSAIKEYQQ